VQRLVHRSLVIPSDALVLNVIEDEILDAGELSRLLQFAGG